MVVIRSLKEVLVRVAMLGNDESVNLYVEVTGSQRPAKHPQVPSFYVGVNSEDCKHVLGLPV